LTREPDEEIHDGSIWNATAKIHADENTAAKIRPDAAAEIRTNDNAATVGIRLDASADIRANNNTATAGIRPDAAVDIHANKNTAAEIRARPVQAGSSADVPVMKATVVSLPSTTVAPASTVMSLPSTSVTPTSSELPSVSATTSSNWTQMLSTQHNDALSSFSNDVQQAIYTDTDRLADGKPFNRNIIDFMEYLIDQTNGGSVGGGVPSGNGGGPPGGPPDNGGDSDSSSSSSIDSPTTSKKTERICLV